VKIYFVHLDPVQEFAAERATLDRFTELLNHHAAEPSGATPEVRARVQLFGWPLVYDDSLPPGFVYGRPTPGAEPRMTTEAIEQYLQTLMSRGRSDS
jgi:hypothetical protein